MSPIPTKQTPLHSGNAIFSLRTATDRLSSRRRAFSLVEVTIAIGLVSFCLVAMLGVLPVGLSQERKSTDQTLATQALSAVVADFQNAATNATNTPAYNVAIPKIGEQTKNSTLALDEYFTTNSAKQFEVSCRVEAPSTRFSNYRLSVRVARSSQANVAANLDTYGTDYVESVVLKSAQ